MSTVASEIDLFEVIVDHIDESGIHLTKGDVVKVIKKEEIWFTFEKDGKTGKVLKEILHKYSPVAQQDDIQQQKEELQYQIGEQRTQKDFEYTSYQEQDILDYNNPNLGIISIDDRRYEVINELINQGLFTR
ncbi:MAG: hypothetical protein EZS28_028183, partial [Streblomastix strix]